MISLTCPLPENINPLKSNGFLLTINKLPLVSFFSQGVDLPGINLPAAMQATPLANAFFAGDKIQYDSLNINFLVDENMNNFYEIYNWINGLGFPEDHLQYTNFQAMDTFNTSEAAKNASDGNLAILNNSNVTVRNIKFMDLIPTKLDSLMLASTSNDTVYLQGRVTFSFTAYEFA